jgi:hypothetical protein
MSDEAPGPSPSPVEPVLGQISGDHASHGVLRRKAALGFIFATALMDIMAIGIVIPVLRRW